MSGGDQCEVVLVGCGVPLRGMGWYHSTQLLKGKCPSAKLCHVVEPWFLGPGTYNLQQAKTPVQQFCTALHCYYCCVLFFRVA